MLMIYNVPNFYKAQISQKDMNLMKTVFYCMEEHFGQFLLGLVFLDK